MSQPMMFIIDDVDSDADAHSISDASALTSSTNNNERNNGDQCDSGGRRSAPKTSPRTDLSETHVGARVHCARSCGTEVDYVELVSPFGSVTRRYVWTRRGLRAVVDPIDPPR